MSTSFWFPPMRTGSAELSPIYIGCYTGYVDTRARVTGHLWQGRHCSAELW